jgi:hypothetical protein
MVAGYDQGSRQLLSTLSSQDIRRLRHDVSQSESRFGAAVSGGGLSYSRWRPLGLRLSSFHRSDDSKLAQDLSAMALACSFKFVDDQLNRKLIGRLKESDIKHLVDKSGVVHYSAGDEEAMENDLIRAIRDQVFRSWQILSCPKDWIEQYRDYMIQHEIPFSEELIDNQLCFLIPRRYRPDSWRIDEVVGKEARAMR